VKSIFPIQAEEKNLTSRNTPKHENPSWKDQSSNYDESAGMKLQPSEQTHV